jgi:hypothetical protein
MKASMTKTEPATSPDTPVKPLTVANFSVNTLSVCALEPAFTIIQIDSATNTTISKAPSTTPNRVPSLTPR